MILLTKGMKILKVRLKGRKANKQCSRVQEPKKLLIIIK